MLQRMRCNVSSLDRDRQSFGRIPRRMPLSTQLQRLHIPITIGGRKAAGRTNSHLLSIIHARHISGVSAIKSTGEACPPAVLDSHVHGYERMENDLVHKTVQESSPISSNTQSAWWFAVLAAAAFAVAGAGFTMHGYRNSDGNEDKIVYRYDVDHLLSRIRNLLGSCADGDRLSDDGNDPEKQDFIVKELSSYLRSRLLPIRQRYSKGGSSAAAEAGTAVVPPTVTAKVLRFHPLDRNPALEATIGDELASALTIQFQFPIPPSPPSSSIPSTTSSAISAAATASSSTSSSPSEPLSSQSHACTPFANGRGGGGRGGSVEKDEAYRYNAINSRAYIFAKHLLPLLLRSSSQGENTSRVKGKQQPSSSADTRSKNNNNNNNNKDLSNPDAGAERRQIRSLVVRNPVAADSVDNKNGRSTHELYLYSANRKLAIVIKEKAAAAAASREGGPSFLPQTEYFTTASSIIGKQNKQEASTATATAKEGQNNNSQGSGKGKEIRKGKDQHQTSASSDDNPPHSLSKSHEFGRLFDPWFLYPTTTGCITVEIIKQNAFGKEELDAYVAAYTAALEFATQLEQQQQQQHCRVVDSTTKKTIEDQEEGRGILREWKEFWIDREREKREKEEQYEEYEDALRVLQLFFHWLQHWTNALRAEHNTMAAGVSRSGLQIYDPLDYNHNHPQDYKKRNSTVRDGFAQGIYTKRGERGVDPRLDRRDGGKYDSGGSSSGNSRATVGGGRQLDMNNNNSTVKALDTLKSLGVDVFNEASVLGNNNITSDQQTNPSYIASENRSSSSGYYNNSNAAENERVAVSGSTLDWDSLAGYAEVKRIMRDSVVNTVKHPEIYDAIARGTKVILESNRPRALLLEGPPGTGKTLTARILAAQCGRPLVVLKSENFVSKWYGESEKKLAQIFDCCDRVEGGVLIFIDEIDAFAPSRDSAAASPSSAGGGGSQIHEVTRRVLSLLLQRMEGFHGKSNNLLVCATNRAQDLDAALLSRFDLVIRYDYPDFSTRAQIFKRYAKQFNVSSCVSNSGGNTPNNPSFWGRIVGKVEKKEQPRVSSRGKDGKEEKEKGGATEGPAEGVYGGPAEGVYGALAAASEGLSCRDIKDICEQAERACASRLIDTLSSSSPPSTSASIHSEQESEERKRAGIFGSAEGESRYEVKPEDLPSLEDYLISIRQRKHAQSSINSSSGSK